MPTLTEWMEQQLATPTGSLFIPLAFVLARAVIPLLIRDRKRATKHRHKAHKAKYPPSAPSGTLSL